MPPKVLIVEDEPDLVRSLEYNFRKARFEVVFVTSGEEAVRRAVAELPDVVLLDRMLPDMDGIEVLRQIRATPETKHIPVVVVTAKGDETDRAAALEIGADDYVTKPFGVGELLGRVRAVLRG